MNQAGHLYQLRAYLGWGLGRGDQGNWGGRSWYFSYKAQLVGCNPPGTRALPRTDRFRRLRKAEENPPQHRQARGGWRNDALHA